MMEMTKVLQELDRLFAQNRLDEIEKFLQEHYEQAVREQDMSSALSLLNELIGFYREMTMPQQTKETAVCLLEMIEKAGCKGTLAEGTSLLNVANAYRFLGEYELSEQYYAETERLYEQYLPKDDFRWASLYNNQSLLYSTTQKHEKAAESLQRALELVKKQENADIETAVTYTNLGQAYLKLEKEAKAEEALLLAEKIFVKTEKTDYHYSGCANALGTLFYRKKEYKRAIFYYEEALLQIYDTVGMTQNYEAVYRNLMEVYEASGIVVPQSVMELGEAYYETYGIPMIREQFGEYESCIAAGLCGEGSECFGFEDEISLDHDCGPGFSLFVTDETYAKIGEALQKAYEALPRIFMGRIRQETVYGRGRVGVCTINGFYERVLGGYPLPETEKMWKKIPEYALACATNGKIFTDPQGIFTHIRNSLLAYYPDNVWKEKLARALFSCAQTGQYNYGRMMARQEYVAADLMLAEYMKQVLQCVFLINRKYAPHDKWLHKGAKELEVLAEIPYILEAIHDMPCQKEAWENRRYQSMPNEQDMVAMTIEVIARLLVVQLQKMGLSQSDNLYLEEQGKEIIKHMEKDRELTKEEKIALIVELEWKQFDKVQNEGGRAGCQDDWNTFSLMRKSQYMTWTEEMLSEYIWHFQECLEKGRNLITEKYGRMMESTAPAEYEKIKEAFGVLSEERKKIQEAIIGIQVGWMEEFAQKYPQMAGNARSIHTSEDNPYNTSYETYLRGELGTYSETLLSLYGRWIAQLAKEGKNLAYETMTCTAKLYGYESVEAAEKALKR